MYQLYTIEFALLILWAAFWYKAADVEGAMPLLWTGMSIGVYVLTWQVLRWGWLGCSLGQLVLLLAVATIRALWTMRSR